MTEEEIRKLADHYISEKFPLNHSWEKGDEHRAFIAGVHSRDEEVKKLEDEIEELEQALAFAEDVVDIQKKKIEQQNQGWISVDERLPEKTKALFSCQVKDKEEDKLVFYKDTRGYIHTGYLNAKGHWRDYDRDNGAIYQPTHWMPIKKENKKITHYYYD